jgi:sialate O-acetylesterase
MNKFFSIFVALFLALGAHAEVRLSRIFSDNMVLQQQSKVALWGWAKAGSVVKITPSWDGKLVETKAGADGKWKAFVATPKASKAAYQITFSDGKPVTLKNVLIGEVWLCSGQSNMEMPMKGFKGNPILNGNMDILKSKNPMLRLITVKRNGQLAPVDTISGTWQEAAPETVKEFSATGYYFGKLLNEMLDTPVGLILCSWGGSTIEAWMNREMLKDFPETKFAKQGDTIKAPNRTPLMLFNGMLNPIIGYGIKGCIWYQGESNYENPDQYPALMKTMVSNWRQLWGEGDFPFYYCQIAPYNYASISPKEKWGGKFNSAYLREAQFKAQKLIPNSGMVSLMDIGEEFCIHPMRKNVGGERLALMALAKTYGQKGFAYESPVLKDMTIDKDGKAILNFENAPLWLTSFGKELKTFEIAGEDKVFHPAQAQVKRAIVEVSSPDVPKPVAVRYAFKDFVVGDLFSNEGLPVSSFRTDNW